MEAATSQAAPREPLSRDRVLHAAAELADGDGIDALSMRRLAKDLGVEAMSLYNHVKNKDEILAGIIDLALAEIELPDAEGDWKAAMRRSSISAKDVFLRHPWVSQLMYTRQSGGPASMRRGEWMLATLRKAGFSADVTYHAYHVLNAYVQGVTSQHLAIPYKGEELAKLARDFMKDIPSDEFPYTIEHIEQHLDPAEEHKGGFELGLDLILDGLEQMRDAV
jgi:AcrR family transcriptional regulator